MFNVSNIVLCAFTRRMQRSKRRYRAKNVLGTLLDRGDPSFRVSNELDIGQLIKRQSTTIQANAETMSSECKDVTKE